MIEYNDNQIYFITSIPIIDIVQCRQIFKHFINHTKVIFAFFKDHRSISFHMHLISGADIDPLRAAFIIQQERRQAFPLLLCIYNTVLLSISLLGNVDSVAVVHQHKTRRRVCLVDFFSSFNDNETLLPNVSQSACRWLDVVDIFHRHNICIRKKFYQNIE